MNWFEGEKVLVPFDFSDESIETVKVALDLAEAPQDVHVLHVLMPESINEPAVVWHDKFDDARLTTVTETMTAKLAEAKLTGPQLKVLIGSPGSMIAEFADEIKAGMIVIPSHGLSGIKRFLLGSVAERVVRLAHCPVLVLKESAED